MPSALPILSYAQSQETDFSTSASALSNGGSSVTSPKPARRKESRSAGRAAEGGRKSEGSSRDAKKSSKKKRRPGRKAASRNGALDECKVEELVAKARARAQSVQAVKNSILEIQLLLLNGVQEQARLQATSPLLTQSEYSDVVTERSISKECGYPLCQNGLVTDSSRKGRYRISLHEHKVYDLSETRLFCSANCLVASKTFQSSLQIERDQFIAVEKLMRMMDYIRDPVSPRFNGLRGSKDQPNQSVPSNESLVSGIQEREDSAIESFDDAGAFDAVEGYVPHNSTRQQWPSNKIAQKPENGNGDQSQPVADLERMAIGDEASPIATKGKSPLTLDELDELDVDFSHVPLLKSALKKGTTVKTLKRNVSWEDQKKKAQKSEKKEGSSRPKERPEVHTPFPQSPLSSSPSDSPTSIGMPVGGDSVAFSSGTEEMGEDSNPSDGQISGKSVLTSSNAGPVENPVVPAENSVPQKSQRVLSAEAVAAALAQAAEAASGGEIGSEEAVAQAGLSIVPVTEDVEVSETINVPADSSLNPLEVKPANDSTSTTEIDVRWPMAEPPQEDDHSFSAAKGAWHSTPPKNFKVEVSMFGTIWMALEEWISAATIAHIYGKEPQDEDEFVVANGREFRRQVHDADSTSSEISRTFSTCLSRAFPDVVQALRLNVPISILEQNIGRLVRTMTFIEALPAFSVQHWGMILMLLLDGLSVQRLPSVGVHLTNNMALLRKFLDWTGTSEAEYDTFRGLLLPLGRLPTFSSMRGG